MNRDKARIAVYALGGLYLLYLAWQMFQELPTAGSEKPLMIVFLIFFVVIGAAMVGWGLYTSWKAVKGRTAVPETEEDPQNKEDGSDENKSE